MWLSRLRTQLVSMRMQVQSLASLGKDPALPQAGATQIWHCLAVAEPPSLRTSTCRRCSPKKRKKEKKTTQIPGPGVLNWISRSETQERIQVSRFPAGMGTPDADPFPPFSRCRCGTPQARSASGPSPKATTAVPTRPSLPTTSPGGPRSSLFRTGFTR